MKRKMTRRRGGGVYWAVVGRADKCCECLVPRMVECCRTTAQYVIIWTVPDALSNKTVPPAPAKLTLKKDAS